MGGPDPTHNVRLATAIENASRANVPKRLIESALRRGAGLDKDSSSKPTELAVYEGMGPGGTAFVVEALTDNKSRTVSQVKSCFSKATGGAGMAPTAYMFRRQGWIECALKGGQESVDDAFEELIEVGAEDISSTTADENSERPGELLIVVYTEVPDTARVADGIKAAGYTIRDMGIEYAPNDDAKIEDAELSDETRAAFTKLAQTLDDLDDVLEIYTNVV